MAKFYLTTGYNDVAIRNEKICMDQHQLDALQYIVAAQLCRMDEPQYGSMILSGMPTNEDVCEIMTATMCGGGFQTSAGTSDDLARRSIDAAVNYPDIDKHYIQMADSDLLWGNAYFDEGLSVLVLAASHGQLLLALQLSSTEDGEEYAKEHLLKAYATATMALQRMMPQDEILQSSCVTALSEMNLQYHDCGCYDGLQDDLKWVEGTFDRGRHPVVHQWKLWQEERPELKTYFKQ